MGPDRDSILRTDFPLVRRGYDPAAVGEHLRSLADAVGGAAGKVATSVSAQVEAIVAAAEQAAADIEQQARQAAARLSDGAADRAKEDAGRVAGATEGLSRRIESIETELGELLGDLRTRVDAIGAAISELEVGFDDAFLPDEPSPAKNGARPAATDDAAAGGNSPAGAGAPADEATRDNARLVALNMALSGCSRAEIDTHLAEHFEQLADRSAVLDEVAAAAGSS